MHGKPLVDREYLLERSPGKGGWTYAVIHEILPDKNASFSWVRVSGTIDGLQIADHHLMPSGKGTLILSVKADIRKKIKKQAGDYVHVVLYAVNGPLEVPEELLSCLGDEPDALKFFQSLSESQRHNYVKWIYSAKGEQTKADRIAKAIDRLLLHLKFTDQD